MMLKYRVYIDGSLYAMFKSIHHANSYLSMLHGLDKHVKLLNEYGEVIQEVRKEEY